MKTVKKLNNDNCCGKPLKVVDPRRKKDLGIKKVIKKRTPG
jgi:hypothetical protein